jgi:hypothetical protein
MLRAFSHEVPGAKPIMRCKAVRLGNAHGIIALAPRERNPRQGSWGLPAFPASGCRAHGTGGGSRRHTSPQLGLDRRSPQGAYEGDSHVHMYTSATEDVWYLKEHLL